MSNCPLCYTEVEGSRIVYSTHNVYSMIPIAPLVEGHAMILPKSHKKFEDVSSEELNEMKDMLTTLKDRLVSSYHDKHPIIVTLTDTDHSSVKDHFHYHIIPSSGNIRQLMAKFDESVSENERLDLSRLEEMAILLRT
tara:strand:- start:1493 stop:1906 length:414 start_codon:yes stop_codon:yes gene_type:complete